MKVTPRLLGIAAGIGVLALLAAPVLLYVLTFHGSISDQHIRWAEFGAYAGGIYAPFAAFLTLLIISRQLSSQTEFNKHQSDQSFLANARADLHFYLDQLRQTLNTHEKLANVPLSHVLVTMFGSKSHEQLHGGTHGTDARRITMSDDRLSALWGAVYTIFEGLRAVDEPEYRNVFASSKQKCIAMLGYAVCDALDNHHFVACNYPVGFRYEFHAGARPEL
jgi:hypothetical protein